MSRILASLLGADQQQLSATISRLETLSGLPSVDVRLTAEIIGKMQLQMRALGLDPHDTSGKEVYHALLGVARLHDEFLARHLGAHKDSSSRELIELLFHAVKHLNIPKSAWVMKHSAAKRLIKAKAPKNTMKLLGYRSMDSMLKREPIGQVFAAMHYAETAAWQEDFLKRYEHLQPSDFESRPIELLMPTSKQWERIGSQISSRNRSTVVHVTEIGAVLVVPISLQRKTGIVLTTFPLILHYIAEIRSFSAYFKMQQVYADFGKRLYSVLHNSSNAHVMVHGNAFGWPVIQRYFGTQSSMDHPEVFEPHVLAEDLSWRKAEDTLFRLEPALHFWKDMDYVGIAQEDGLPVSFSLMDIAVCLVNDLEYDERVSYHMRESLWNEVLIRYMGTESIKNQVLKQLDHGMIEPDMVMLGNRRSV